MLAAEALKAHDMGKLPEAPFAVLLGALAADAALPRAEFEADVQKRLGSAICGGRAPPRRIGRGGTADA